MDINGFEIEEYNVHGLKENKKDQICPKCSHTRSSKNQRAECASADWERGLLTCHHCGEVTQLHKFKRKREKVYIKPKSKSDDIDSKVSDYFHSRGICAETLKKTRVTSKQGWIHFNYFEQGELINIKSRNAKKEFRLEKGAERILYNIDNTIGHDYIIITEGEFDTLSAVEAGYPSAVSVPNGAVVGTNNLDYLDNSIGYFEGKSKIILATDNDEAGEALRAELIRRFGSEVCYICELGSFKDLNEALVDGGKDAVRRAIDSAKPVPLDGVNTISDISNDIDKYIRDGGPKVYKPGIPGVDDLFSVIPGTTLVITATPGAGKTFFIDQYCVGMMERYGWKSAIASPETKPDYIAAGNILTKLYGDLPRNMDVGSNRYSEIKTKMNDNFFYIDMESFNLDAVLKKGQELVKRKGIKILVIDPINIIRDRERDSIQDYTISYFKKCNEFAKRNDCLVILSCHPVKVVKNESGDFPDLDYYSIAGGSDIANMAYYIIMLNRMYSVKQTKIKTLKVKYNFNGMAGEERYFKYNLRNTNFDVIEQKNENDMPW